MEDEKCNGCTDCRCIYCLISDTLHLDFCNTKFNKYFACHPEKLEILSCTPCRCNATDANLNTYSKSLILTI